MNYNSARSAFESDARGSRRVCSTIFTDKAFLNFKQGKLFLSFQIAEMRDDVPFEAHVRVYVIRHVEHPARTIYYQTSPVRLFLTRIPMLFTFALARSSPISYWQTR